MKIPCLNHTLIIPCHEIKASVQKWHLIHEFQSHCSLWPPYEPNKKATQTIGVKRINSFCPLLYSGYAHMHTVIIFFCLSLLAAQITSLKTRWTTSSVERFVSQRNWRNVQKLKKKEATFVVFLTREGWRYVNCTSKNRCSQIVPAAVGAPTYLASPSKSILLRQSRVRNVLAIFSSEIRSAVARLCIWKAWVLPRALSV